MSQRHIALAGFALGFLALAIALGSEHFLGLIPCALCLLERWPYRFAMIVAVIAIASPAQYRVYANALMVLVFVGAAAAAAVHVGVEQHWWRSPFPECMAPDLAGLSPAERFARMPLNPSKSCEDRDYLIPWLPVTMAQGNLGYALASAAILSICLARPRRRLMRRTS